MAKTASNGAPASEAHERGQAGSDDPPGADESPIDVGQAEKELRENSRLSALKIYEILRREGEDEMSRPTTSLVWSGIAAGLSISFSLIVEGGLRAHLPDTPWRPLITGFGYTVGFVIAVMARHQLFTENTITVVLPVAARPSFDNLRRMGRLWGLVLCANLAGTLLAALFCSYTSVLSSDVRAAMLTISLESTSHPQLEIFVRAIVGGFLIAAMVWLLPSANATQFHVIVLMTYLIAIGGFAHVVAGSFEGFMLLVNGRISAWDMLIGFDIPALMGNIVGGTALFSLISYAQVAKEM
jgi:formate/nitrite transporter FocA (FNT family)